MGEYRVNLDIFAGPLDLLLYLVRKEEVDIYDISITNVTKQYLSYLEMLKTLDVDLAGDFLVMAATLMQIKSAMLLPKADPDQITEDDLNDPRAELIRQLLEYKKFKDAANLLNDAAHEQKLRFNRPATVVENLTDGDPEPAIDIEQVSIWDLLEAFNKIMEATNSGVDFSHITDDTPIDLYQIEILHRLQTEGPMTFENIFESCGNRLVLIGLFLALLELVREKLIWTEQAGGSNSIFLKSLTEEPAEQAVHEAMLATYPQSDPDIDTDEQNSENQQHDEPQTPPIPISELPAKKQTDTAFDEQENIEAADKDVGIEN